MFRHIYTFDVIPRATAVAQHCKVLSKNNHDISHNDDKKLTFRDQVKRS